VKRIGYMVAGVVLGAMVALQVPSLAQDRQLGQQHHATHRDGERHGHDQSRAG
jgi:hypothetical protein